LEWQTAAPQRGPAKPLKIRINGRIFPDTFIIAAYRSWRYAARLHIRINCHGKEIFLVGSFISKTPMARCGKFFTQHRSAGAVSLQRVAAATLAELRRVPEVPSTLPPP
jgi:hypothetical protein